MMDDIVKMYRKKVNGLLDILELEKVEDIGINMVVIQEVIARMFIAYQMDVEHSIKELSIQLKEMCAIAEKSINERH